MPNQRNCRSKLTFVIRIAFGKETSPGDTTPSLGSPAGAAVPAGRISSQASIPAKRMALKLAPGITAARQIIPVATVAASTIPGEHSTLWLLLPPPSFKASILISPTFFFRCFVGDEPDQWRKCSDRYYPGKNGTTATHSSLGLPSSKQKHKHAKPHQPASAASSEYTQHPPRPGGLQSLSDFAAARLWPVTYLYSEGPPNATEFSNFVDCNKETC